VNKKHLLKITNQLERQMESFSNSELHRLTAAFIDFLKNKSKEKVNINEPIEVTNVESVWRTDSMPELPRTPRHKKAKSSTCAYLL
jgi:UDP-N-acetylglucosamine pyrophosphorylase